MSSTISSSAVDHANRGSSFLLRTLGRLIFCLVAIGVQTLLNGQPSSSSESEKVKVEIIEKIPDELSWNFSAGTPSESYAEPVFGFSAMPARYSPRGIRVDRSKPFLFRASAAVKLPPGKHRILLRAHTGARLLIEGVERGSIPFPNYKADGHEEVPALAEPIESGIRQLRPGHEEKLFEYESDGTARMFVLESLIGLKDRRPELGELCVSVAAPGSRSFHLLAPGGASDVELTEEGFETFAVSQAGYWRGMDAAARKSLAYRDAEYWRSRHEFGRKWAERSGNAKARGGDVDALIDGLLAEKGVVPAPLADDFSFLRRLAFDTTGLAPSELDLQKFLGDAPENRRSLAVDRFLQKPGWAANWVGYWQDVLAENPGILKPMLNNTGPFRTWIYESFLDNKPFDKFVTELVLMEGSAYYGGPAGFGMATDNDVPMAQKAQILGQAFLGMEMQCARCHDAPNHEFKQRELFSMAAMLRRDSQVVPWSSSIPTNAHITLGRKVKVTLAPGSKVAPAWPFESMVRLDQLPAGILRNEEDTREQLAALITSPENPRFSKVIVNRLWKRYLGWGIVEPVDDWEHARPSHPELLDHLASELVSHDYDLKHVARLILNSRAYQRKVLPSGSEEKGAGDRLFASPARRRLTAEQIVDSLFAIAGKEMGSEELNMDVDSRRPVKEFNNLGVPSQSWQFTSLSNERDRPALSLPRAQSIVDVLTSFGWRESRQNPLSVRDDSPNLLQPASLANGALLNGRIARLSDDHALTVLALQAKPLEQFVEDIYLRVYSRRPEHDEVDRAVQFLGPGYTDRIDPEHRSVAHRTVRAHRPVSWANHLNPDATRIKMEQEKEARLGDVPTLRLKADWRERVEDFLWAMVNSPEFIFLP